MLCDQPNNIFEAATKGPKGNLSNNQRNSKYERKSVLIKLLMLFNYCSNQTEKLIAAVKILLLNVSVVYLIKRKISSRKNEISVGNFT